MAHLGQSARGARRVRPLPVDGPPRLSVVVPGADPSTIVFQRSRVLPATASASGRLHRPHGHTGNLGDQDLEEARPIRVVAPVGGGSPHPPDAAAVGQFRHRVRCRRFAAGGKSSGRGPTGPTRSVLTFADGYVDGGRGGRRREYRIALFFEPEGVIFPADVEILDGRARFARRLQGVRRQSVHRLTSGPARRGLTGRAAGPSARSRRRCRTATPPVRPHCGCGAPPLRRSRRAHPSSRR